MKLPAHELKTVLRIAVSADACRVACRELETRLRESGDTQNATALDGVAKLFEVSALLTRRVGT